LGRLLVVVGRLVEVLLQVKQLGDLVDGFLVGCPILRRAFRSQVLHEDFTSLVVVLFFKLLQGQLVARPEGERRNREFHALVVCLASLVLFSGRDKRFGHGQIG